MGAIANTYPRDLVNGSVLEGRRHLLGMWFRTGMAADVVVEVLRAWYCERITGILQRARDKAVGIFSSRPRWPNSSGK